MIVALALHSLRVRYEIAVDCIMCCLLDMLCIHNFFFLQQTRHLEDDVSCSTVTKKATKRSDIKLKPRTKAVLEPRVDLYSPDPVKKAGRQGVRKVRKAMRPAVIESSDDDDDDDLAGTDGFVLQQHDKMPPRRGGKVRKCNK